MDFAFNAGFFLLVVTVNVILAVIFIVSLQAKNRRRLSRANSRSNLRSERIEVEDSPVLEIENYDPLLFAAQDRIISECPSENYPLLEGVTFARTDFTPTCSWSGRGGRGRPSTGDFFRLNFSPITEGFFLLNRSRKYIVRWGPNLSRGTENPGYAVIGQGQALQQNGWGGGKAIVTCGGSTLMRIRTLACCEEIKGIQLVDFDPNGGFSGGGIVSLSWKAFSEADQYLVSAVISNYYANPDNGERIDYLIYTGGITSNTSGTYDFFGGTNSLGPYVLESYQVFAFRSEALGPEVAVTVT